MSSNFSTFECFKDPKKFGPGIWFVIHSFAWKTRKREDKIFFCKLIYELSEDLRCSKCQEHFKEYLRNNPPELCFAINDESTIPYLFKWSWNFHNSVNERIGKQKMDFNNLVDFFSSKDNICFKC
jgi:hypothetical protein